MVDREGINSSGETDDLQTKSADSLLLGLRTLNEADLFDSNANHAATSTEEEDELSEIERRKNENANKRGSIRFFKLFFY